MTTALDSRFGGPQARVAFPDQAARDDAARNNPCPFQKLVIRFMPGTIVTERGVNVPSFVAGMKSAGWDGPSRALVNKVLQDLATKPSDPKGEWVTAADIRKSKFFDALSTFFVREGYNDKRFNEAVDGAKTITPSVIARYIRACKAEQGAGAKPTIFTMFEHSAIRFLVGGIFTSPSVDTWKGFFRDQEAPRRAFDPFVRKGLDHIALSMGRTALAYGAQVCLAPIVKFFTGRPNMPVLTPVAVGSDATGAAHPHALATGPVPDEVARAAAAAGCTHFKAALEAKQGDQAQN